MMDSEINSQQTTITIIDKLCTRYSIHYYKQPRSRNEIRKKSFNIFSFFLNGSTIKPPERSVILIR